MNKNTNHGLILYTNVAPKYVNYIIETSHKNGYKELYLLVSNIYLFNLLKILKNNSNTLFKVLIDIICIDYPERVNRFELNYHLLSLKYNTRINIKTYIDEISYNESITAIYPNAMWSEREVWDMYGVLFVNNPDLRRILTDYGFDGFPLRKDFPLSGYSEVIYDDTIKNVVYQELSVAQQYRNFEYRSAW